jgi:hypothetical protein
MTHPARHRLALDLDQATALRVLRTVFGAAQVTVTNFQPIDPADRDPAVTQTPAWQTTLCEETS